jgi:hypothetical protein
MPKLLRAFHLTLALFLLVGLAGAILQAAIALIPRERSTTAKASSCGRPPT